MAKRPPEKYNPGDLDRTRSNLGELSREEAERMKNILGGEIGIEKIDEELQQKYDHLRRSSSSGGSGRNRLPGGASGKPGSGELRKPPSGGFSEQHHSAPAYTGHYISRKEKKTRLGYFDRVKIDRMAARNEHRIKSRSDLVTTYMSFLVKSRDRVNPDFITDGDTFFYRHIETLVQGLRSLLKLVKPEIFRNYINPYYRDLLKDLISWDLDEMNNIMSDLQKSPRNRDIQDCERLCMIIYKPIISVMHVDIKHLYAAADRLYRILLLLNRDDPEELIRIKNTYLDIKEKIKIVFKDVAFTCYPLLLKLTGVKFHYYKEFMVKKRKMILHYMNIDESKLVDPPEDLQELGKKQYSLSHLKNKLDKQKAEELEALNKKAGEHSDGDIAGSLDLLEQLYPESGWKKMNDYPDFYPYFHPLFNFPKGAELIAAEDPLQQILVLASVVQDLLYGFRNVEIKSERKESIEKIADSWHLFNDELVQKNYCKMLIEYCRNIEKGYDYSTSKFGQKLLTDIYWFKRRFVFPYLKFKILYKSDSIPLKAMKFHELIRKFYTALSDLMEEFDKSSDGQSVIGNYNTEFRFEISNVTSYRLKKILTKENVAPTNENLLRYSLMIVSLMDFLTNSPNSPYYAVKQEDVPIYRYDPVYQGKPRYSVPLIDTETLLKKY